MAKQIVGLFDKNFDKIEFYEIEDNWEQFTILRKQGTNKYYLYDNKKRMLTADKFHIISIPEDKSKYKELIQPDQYQWAIDVVFFWADSKFVTSYGLPGYDRMVEMYKSLVNIRYSDYEVNKQLELAKKEGVLVWLCAKLSTKRFTWAQQRLLNKIIREYKIIW